MITRPMMKESLAVPVETLPTLRDRLMREGIVELVDPFPAEVLARWNAQLDAAFTTVGDEERAYVGAGELARMGVLDELFGEGLGLVGLIRAIMPSAVLYHCHAYEIAARQGRSHINADRLDGWHRDREAVGRQAARSLRYVSVFVYLSDVGADSGAFELLPRSPQRSIRAGQPCARMVGPVGTTFVWNRNFYHRASPNRSAHRRRLLKLSLQPPDAPNDRICLDEFVAARTAVAGGDPFLDQLLGVVPAVEHLPEIRAVTPDQRVAVSRRDEVIHRLSSMRYVLAR